MAAPTPVSAYLHAAAMVKAGIYLVARLAPGVRRRPRLAADRARPRRASRCSSAAGGRCGRHDLKLLLAFGTVSQLGFLDGAGRRRHRDAALAGLAMLLAHALFKSALFLVVGVIDHATGTRDLRELSGLGRRLPVRRGRRRRWPRASMAGMPPLLGFVAQGGGVRRAAATAAWPTAPAASWRSSALVAGSALTVAYTLRFLWGAFATQARTCRPTPARPAPPGGSFLAAPALLAVAGLRRSAWPPAARAAGSPRTPTTLPGRRRAAEQLALWHGWQPRAACSRAVALAGRRGPVRRPRPRSRRCQRRHAVARRRPTRATGACMQGLDRLAVAGHRRHPARLAAGLPRHASSSSSLALPGTAAADAGRRGRRSRGSGTPRCRPWSAPSSLVAAVARAARPRSGCTAVLLVGVTGYALAVLFVAARRARPRAHPDPRRDAHARRLRAGAAPAADERSPTGTGAASARVARSRSRSPSARSWPAIGAGRLGRADRRPRSRPASPTAAYDVRRRQEHRQRDPGRHPRLGHPRRDLGAGRGRDRRGQPDLPAPPHRRRRPRPAPRRDRPTAVPPRDAAAARGWPAGGRCAPSSARSCSRWSPGCSSTPSSCSRSTCSSPGTTSPAAASPAAWSPGWRWSCATSPAAATSSARPRPVDAGLLLGAGLLVAVGTGVVGAAARRRRCCRATILELHLPRARRRASSSPRSFFDIGVYLDRGRPGARHPAQPRRRARPAGSEDDRESTAAPGEVSGR